MAKEELEMEEEQAKQHENEKKEQILNDEYQRFYYLNDEYQELFKNGENEQPWEKKPEIRKTITLLDKKKDLERKLLEMNLKIEEKNQNKRRLEEQYQVCYFFNIFKTLVSANANETKEDFTNEEYLDSKIKELEGVRSEIQENVNIYFISRLKIQKKKSMKLVKLILILYFMLDHLQKY